MRHIWANAWRLSSFQQIIKFTLSGRVGGQTRTPNARIFIWICIKNWCDQIGIWPLAQAAHEWDSHYGRVEDWKRFVLLLPPVSVVNIFIFYYYLCVRARWLGECHYGCSSPLFRHFEVWVWLWPNCSTCEAYLGDERVGGRNQKLIICCCVVGRWSGRRCMFWDGWQSALKHRRKKTTWEEILRAIRSVGHFTFRNLERVPIEEKKNEVKKIINKKCTSF